MNNGVDYHELDKRASSLEQWRGHMDSREIPAIREAIKEIPGHYSRRIQESESRLKLEIGQIIDERLKTRFGWMPRILEGVVQSVLIVLAIYWLGLG